VSVVTLDATASAETLAAAGLMPATVDHVLMNPPFWDPARAQTSADPDRRRAHAAPRETLSAWVGAAERLLRSAGTLTLIFSADGIGDVLAALATRFGGVAVLPIYPKPAAPAVRVLVRAVKGSRAPLALCPGLLLNGDNGRPTAAAEAILRAAAGLTWGETGEAKLNPAGG